MEKKRVSVMGKKSISIDLLCEDFVSDFLKVEGELTSRDGLYPQGILLIGTDNLVLNSFMGKIKTELYQRGKEGYKVIVSRSQNNLNGNYYPINLDYYRDNFNLQGI
jgi:hypothetical protein